jgi:hypothetical protein
VQNHSDPMVVRVPDWPQGFPQPYLVSVTHTRAQPAALGGLDLTRLVERVSLWLERVWQDFASLPPRNRRCVRQPVTDVEFLLAEPSTCLRCRWWAPAVEYVVLLPRSLMSS